MKIETGYLYHIKDEFFDIVNDESLMTNHERGKKRPTYFTIKDGEILWFIPLSSKFEKYEKIIEKKKVKYGFCNTILIKKIFGKKHAILVQNAFPTLEKYIDHVHLIDGKPALVPEVLQQEILDSFISVMKLKERGINLFYANIDEIRAKMLSELVTV